MNGAKPGASACFWVKGGAGVLVGRSVNQSIGRWAIVGGRRKVESGLVLLLSFNFDLKQREMIWPVRSPKKESRHLTERRWTSVLGFVQNGETMHKMHVSVENSLLTSDVICHIQKTKTLEASNLV